MEKNWFMNIVSKKQYLENPCGTLSVPYWKANCTTVPDHMKILHHREFYPELLDKYFDEPYFRLQHHLQEVDSVSMPDGYSLYKATIPEFAEHINKCYKDVCLSVSELQSYIARRVYCPELWLAVKDINTGEIVATGIAELDEEIGEGVLEWIQVSKNYRRCGLGRYMVLDLLRRMKNTARFVTVSGQCCSPDKPEELYRKCGFIGNDVWHILREKR